MSGRRVVVTGTGCATVSAVGTEDLLECLRTGRSGVRIEGRDSRAWTLDPGPVDFEGRVPRLALRRLDITMKSALHAALQAVDSAGWEIAEPTTALGVVVGTGFAGTDSSHAFIRTVWEDGPEGADPSLFPNTVPNGPAGQLAIRLKARGPGTNFFETDTAGESALDYARREIVAGRADAILVCGVDERAEGLIAVEDHLRRGGGRTLPAGLLRPFDEERTGTALGGGAAAVLLEAEEAARNRGVETLAVVGPVALAAEATPPGRWVTDPGRLVRVASRAMYGAGVAAGDLAFVTASARGAREFDALEAEALRRLSSEWGRYPPVCAPAGYCGSLNASGVFRLVVSILGLREGAVPATARLNAPDPALSVPVSPAAEAASGRAVLQVGAGAGGTHAALVASLP